MNFIGYLLNDTITQESPDRIMWTPQRTCQHEAERAKAANWIDADELIPILEDLAKEGRIRIDKDTIFLI
jgi:hypothetical protein